ncbi:MAG: ArnT family glycosyltransferase [Bradymonadia bacterium]
MTGTKAGLDRAGVIFLALATVLMTIGTVWFGIWEPWEAETARVLDAMAAEGSWMAVLHGAGEQAQVVPELPYGWWPIRATTAMLGTTELGLRLPSLLITLVVLWAMYVNVKRLYGAQAALLSGVAVLTMPLFAFHGRHAMGLSVGAGLMALGALGLIRAAADDEAPSGWRWLGWGAAALSGLCTGATGLAAPLFAGLASAWDAHKRGKTGAFKALLAPGPLALAVVLLGVGWGMALATIDASPSALLLWADPVIAYRGPGLPSFEQFVHQIGFGLYPLAALLPFAFGSMLWADPPSDEPAGAQGADPGVAIWFAAAFLGPALAVPATGPALFPGAPAVAIAVGVYLARALRHRPTPVVVMGAVMIMYLLDSNLSHNTRYLADTLVAAEVEDFPAKLSGWSIARLLTLSFIAIMLLYHADLKDKVKGLVVKVAYPKRIDGALIGILVVLAVILAVVVQSAAPNTFEQLVNANNKTWRRLVVGIRGLIVFVGVWLPIFGVLWALVFARVRGLNGRASGRLTRLADVLQGWLSHPKAGFVATLSILVVWGAFLNLPVARALSFNFSEKHLLSVYQDLADENEPLYRHRLKADDRLFYARDLQDLTVAAFAEKAKSEARFFALIPRKRLSDVHSAMRAANGEILPVLDDTSNRYLLVSNRLEDGEEDHNPIRKALVTELPQGVHKASVNFENKIELVGWRLLPEAPRRGSSLDIELYWKVLERVPSNYKVFVHIDAAGSRIHGDHDPVAGLYPTSKWGVGEIVRDVHKVTVKKSTSAGRHTFYTGLFRGSKRMTIRKGPKDKENRARLGAVSVH